MTINTQLNEEFTVDWGLKSNQKIVKKTTPKKVKTKVLKKVFHPNISGVPLH